MSIRHAKLRSHGVEVNVDLIPFHDIPNLEKGLDVDLNSL
jgi:hypothetical protein